MKRTWFFALSLVFAQAALAQGFKVTDLGPLIPVGVNIDGEVAGNVNGAAAVWTQALGTKELGTLQGGTFSHAVAINDMGVVAGTADGPALMDFGNLGTQECPDVQQPFTWSSSKGFQTAPAIASTWDPLIDIGPCDQQDYATGINIHGQTVGSNDDIATYKSGYVWAGSNGMSLWTGNYQSGANAINDYGIVAGQIGNNILQFASHAAVWVNGTQYDLGSLAGNSSQWFGCSGALSVNDMDEVAGWSGTELSSVYPCADLYDSQAPVHAFVWTSHTGMRDLGTLPGDKASVALKTNLFGVVIGMSGNTVLQNPQIEYALTVTGHPFIWTSMTGMYNLNELLLPGSGWVLNSVADINEWGQIVGTGTVNGETHGYLLTLEF
jgi:hypothetical protein